MQPKTREDYLQSSRQNRIAGFIFLGGGAALLTAGFISSNNSTADSDELFDTGSLATGLIGIGAMLGSVPFFVISANHSAKAARMQAGIKWERGVRQPLDGKTYAYPALTVQYRIR